MMLHVTELATVDVLIISDMYLVGGVEHEFYVSIQLGMSSFQLTNSYFLEG